MSQITFSYKATGYLVSLLDKLFKSNIHVEGLENIVNKPTLFVVNHFTRSETFLLPYIIYKHRNEMVHSLADASLFTGKLGDYLKSLGAISTKEPFRNRTIIQELMQGKYKWVIFPEGIMVKNKKIFENGRYMMDNPERKGPPHSGAAVLALKAEIYKRNYLNATKTNNKEVMEYYEKRYNFSGPDELSFKDIVVSPVNITYYPIRPEQNLFSNLVSYFVRDIPARVEEELKIEGQLLLSKTDISVYFSKPICLWEYLDNFLPVTRTFFPFVSEESRSNLILWWHKKNLTKRFMHEIYTKLAVNIDHIFACIIQYRKNPTVDYGDLAKIIYLSAVMVNRLEDRRVHPSLSTKLIKILSDEEYEPMTNIIKLAKKENAITRQANNITINHSIIHKIHPFHSVRLENLISVFANELEPLKHIVSEIKKFTNLPKYRLRQTIVQVLLERDQDMFKEDYDQYYDKEFSHDKAIGAPFYLKRKKAKTGIVLCHGYLAAPKEVRKLAEYLYNLGHSVYGVRLKGHGTAPRQLADTTHEQWVESFNRGYAIIKNEHENLIVGGFSAGGLLSLLAGGTKNKGIKGIFCINAALKLNDIKSHLVPSVSFWNDLLDKFNIQTGKMEYVENNSESPDVNYGRNYLNGVRELDRLIGLTKKNLENITSPTLIIQADEDPVVNSKSADMISETIRSNCVEKKIVNFNRHNIINGPGSQSVFELIGKFLEQIKGVDHFAEANVETTETTSTSTPH